MMRRETVNKIGRYRPQLPVSEDTDLLLRMSTFGSLDNVPEPLVFYRLNPLGLTFENKARRDYYGQTVMRLWAERMVTGADSLERGEPIAAYIPPKNGNEKETYRLRSVLAHFYRQSAIELAAQGFRRRAIGRLAMSLAYAPDDRRTWKTMAKVATGRFVPNG
jgi:hypothetical protein